MIMQAIEARATSFAYTLHRTRSKLKLDCCYLTMVCKAQHDHSYEADCPQLCPVWNRIDRLTCSDAGWSLVRQCLTPCKSNHNCRNVGSGRLPTRPSNCNNAEKQSSNSCGRRPLWRLTRHPGRLDFYRQSHFTRRKQDDPSE